MYFFFLPSELKYDLKLQGLVFYSRSWKNPLDGSLWGPNMISTCLIFSLKTITCVCTIDLFVIKTYIVEAVHYGINPPNFFKKSFNQPIYKKRKKKCSSLPLVL